MNASAAAMGFSHQPSSLKKIAIVGNPNVGKSVLFCHLTHNYTTVSNYPGTTVETFRSRVNFEGELYEVIDTPGMYSIFSITEEEKDARNILIQEKPDVVIHVVDGKNLDRMLFLTLQLLDAGLPVILLINMMDEVRRAGLEISSAELEKCLGIPVVLAVLTRREGIDKLKKLILSKKYRIRNSEVHDQGLPVYFKKEIFTVIGQLLGETDYGISAWAMSLLILEGDEEVRRIIKEKQPSIVSELEALTSQYEKVSEWPIEVEIALEQKKKVDAIVQEAVRVKKGAHSLTNRLSQWMMHPVMGSFILFVIMYWGFYKFVGVFGAGTVVSFFENVIFAKYVNPTAAYLISRTIPWQALQDLFIGDYGVITLGVRYAVALVLPIVTFFSIFFSIVEDTGYLPRLAMLLDRIFKKIGLSGRAVIPMVLGFGCVTMATLVTRTLPTKRERVISTILLTLAIPCSAQLGVIFALLSGRPLVSLVWGFTILVVFSVVGSLFARFMPGERPSFYMEIPPLRWPQLSNVLMKTYTRVKWYLVEVIPLFVLASVCLWLGTLLGIFNFVIHLMRFPMAALGLPDEAAKVFLFGFFRRDYGAAGLYDLHQTGRLDGVQLAVACVALTLFVPCIAQFLMTIKERGWKEGLLVSAAIVLFSFTVAFFLGTALRGFGAIL